MSMYNDYEFDVEAIEPSGLIQYQSGHASSTRRFKVPCEHAEEFALRQLGKFLKLDIEAEYDEEIGFPAVYKFPILPAPFPFDNSGVIGRGQMNLVATSFSIEPLAKCCFSVRYTTEESDGERLNKITDPTSIQQFEKYFYDTAEDEDGDQEDIDRENEKCECMVIIGYEENPCDCATFNNTEKEWEVHGFLLPGTCISVERNPAYEMFTLPNAALIWKDIPEDPENEGARQLKADSYAYKIIPKADIIVSWNNVPVKHICAIENHLKEFRGTVNSTAWGDFLFCDAAPDNPAACGCGKYEPETIMFVDFQEDRAKRTDCFGGMTQENTWNMNTTTLKLFFKQKRIERPTSESYSDSDDCPDDNDLAYGWNHLFLDRTAEEGGGQWSRVAIAGGDEDPLFPLRSFNTIMYPIL
jgi:hypothetical protein